MAITIAEQKNNNDKSMHEQNNELLNFEKDRFGAKSFNMVN